MQTLLRALAVVRILVVVVVVLVIGGGVAHADASPTPPARAKTLRLSGVILLTVGIVASSVGTSMYTSTWIPAGVGLDCDERCPNQPLRTAGLSLAAIGGPLVGGGIALLALGWNL